MRRFNGKCIKSGLLIGFLFGFIVTLGRYIREDNIRGSILDFFVFFWGKSLVTAILCILFYQLLTNISSRVLKNDEKVKYQFIKIYLLFIPFYSICFLAYFPGIMSYDSWYITLEALGIIGFDNHHPFLHTLIWSIFARLDRVLGINEIGIILYTLLQMLIMTAVYAYVCAWIFRRNIGKTEKGIVFFYLAANPVFHIFSLILTKDVLFSGCFLLLTVNLIDFFEDFEADSISIRKQGRIFAETLLCCLLRNNMIYVIIVLTIIIFFVSKKRIICCRGLLFSILLYYMITQVVYPSVGVARGSIKEMMSVPLSQIAAAYQSNSGDIDEADKEIILKYIPDVEQYDRYFADYIKTNFNENSFRENKWEFISLWCKLFVKFPDKYAEAFLSLNLPYWYPYMESVREYIETGNYSQDYPVIRKNILPAVYDWYEKVSKNQAGFMKIPGMRQIYSIGMPVWVLLFFLVGFISSGKRAFALGMLPVILLWMTYLLGPVSAFRYIEPLLLTYPIWFALSVERKSPDEKVRCKG